MSLNDFRKKVKGADYVRLYGLPDRSIRVIISKELKGTIQGEEVRHELWESVDFPNAKWRYCTVGREDRPTGVRVSLHRYGHEIGNFRAFSLLMKNGAFDMEVWLSNSSKLLEEKGLNCSLVKWRCDRAEIGVEYVSRKFDSMLEIVATEQSEDYTDDRVTRKWVLLEA